MKTNELIQMLVTSGAIQVTPGGKVKVAPDRLSGHWVNNGHGWRRDQGDGGGDGDQDNGQDS